jgi:hypothetical protein
MKVIKCLYFFGITVWLCILTYHCYNDKLVFLNEPEETIEQAPSNDSIVNISNSFLNALALAESNNNVLAKGDNGRSVGCYQITSIYVDDVNRICRIKNLPETYSYSDRTDYEKSTEMVTIYLQYYGELYHKSTNKPVDDEVLARIHNGGPKGMYKNCTKKYWERVKQYL